MFINDLVTLVDGELRSKPSVKKIEGVTLYPSKVDERDLFISNDQDRIQKAIEAGAYAIVFDDDAVEIIDNDIAWIKVEDLHDAMVRFLRYVVVQKEVSFTLLQTKALTFFKMLVPQKMHVAILQSDLKRLFEQVVNSDATRFVSDNASLLEKIAPGTEPYTKQAAWYLIQDTLLRSTFKTEDFVYRQQPLAPFHLEALLQAVAFAKEEMIEFSIERLRYTKHFYPIFLDNHNRPTAFGKSERVAIFVDNEEDIIAARKYISKHNKWLKSIVLTPSNVKIEGVQRPVWFEDKESIVEALQKSHFNYAFIYKADASVLEAFETDRSLF